MMLFENRGYRHSMDLTKIPTLPDWLIELTRHESVAYLCPALQWHADRAMQHVMSHLRAGRDEQIGEERLNAPKPVDMPEYHQAPIRRGFTVER